MPFTCTISLGLLCSYLGSVKWRLWQISVVAAVANGCACMAAGAVLASMLSYPVLAQFYEHPERAKPLIVISTGLIGAAIGAMVLAAFRQSERVRKDVAEFVVDAPRTSASDGRAAAPFGKVELPPCSDAAQNLGGYRRANVEVLEGRYLCLRPAFSVRNVITAYVVTLHWEDSGIVPHFRRTRPCRRRIHTTRTCVYSGRKAVYEFADGRGRRDPAHHGFAARWSQVCSRVDNNAIQSGRRSLHTGKRPIGAEASGERDATTWLH